jgi:hypothetical protein
MADEPVSRMQPWSVANTQVTDSVEMKFVSDVSFGSEVRILATTLPQFSWAVELGDLPSKRGLCLPAAIRAHSPIQVRRTVRGVKYLMEPVLPTLWTLVPAMREFRASGLGAG